MNPLIKRVLVGFVGGLVTLIGVVALVAPGPGWLIIFTGLGILASEFAWAARVLTSARGVANRAANAAKIKKKHRLMIMAALIFGLGPVTLKIKTRHTPNSIKALDVGDKANIDKANIHRDFIQLRLQLLS